MAYPLELYFAALTLVFAWALWAVLRPSIVKTSLDNVRGPPVPFDSFIGGM